MTIGGPIFNIKKEEERPVVVPSTYRYFSTTKIISNYHLYGINYMYAPMAKVLDYINTPILKDAKWVIDEGWLVGESRKGMNPLVVFITEYAQLMRKLNVDLYWLTQHSRFLDWRIRYITKRKILTKYDEKTHQCSLLIQNLEKGTEKQVHYYAPLYWRYYNTYELPPMPEMSIAKARLYT
jgi:hypothetical protein